MLLLLFLHYNSEENIVRLHLYIYFLQQLLFVDSSKKIYSTNKLWCYIMD